MLCISTMELREAKAYWEKRFRECTSFVEKARILEELLLFLEEELVKVLGEENTRGKAPQKSEEKGERDLFEALVEALEVLREREENTLKAPPSRRKVLIKSSAALSVEDLSLQDLLELYVRYLGGKKDGNVAFPDREFERLLEERQRVVLALCAEGVCVPFGKFFEDCVGRKAVIATFLVLLDLVFRNILYLKQEENGDVLLGRVRSEVSPKSP